MPNLTAVMTDPVITKADVMSAALDLLTEPGDENPEYDRALMELVCSLVGLSMEHKDDMLMTLLMFREPL